MTTLSDLKPCPFCGGEAELHRQSYPSVAVAYHHVQCRVCRIRTPEHFNDFNAIAAWNRRAPVQPIPVSEPPGDEDIVLPLWCRDGDPMNWEPYSRPLRGAEFRTKNSSVTHYLLLRKGEDREVRD